MGKYLRGEMVSGKGPSSVTVGFNTALYGSLELSMVIV